MTIIMYERVGFEGRRPSPFSWRIRYVLAHKDVDTEYRPTRFADVDTIEQLSGQRFVPIIVDGKRVVHDSWRIALYLEEKFPDKPSLFGDEIARGTTRFMILWSDTVLAQLLRHLIYADFIRCLAPEDRAYFRTSREEFLGQTLEAACAERSKWQAKLDVACQPLERLLTEQDFLAGGEPRYADYAVFSLFQWARLGSPQDVLKAETAIAVWRSRMVSLFDGLADKFPGYPAAPQRSGNI